MRFTPLPERHARAWLFIPIARTVDAECGLHLITDAKLDWPILTSVSGLVPELWPSFIWLLSLMLREPG